jgi:hypothetical protein
MLLISSPWLLVYLLFLLIELKFLLGVIQAMLANTAASLVIIRRGGFATRKDLKTFIYKS